MNNPLFIFVPGFEIMCAQREKGYRELLHVTPLSEIPFLSHTTPWPCNTSTICFASPNKKCRRGGGYRCHLRRDAVTPSGGGQKAKEAACSKAGIGKGCVMEATLDSTMGPTDNFGCATLNPSLLLVRICYIWFPWEEHTLLVYIFLVFVGCCRWGLVFCGPRDKRCLAQYLT